jgi:hypothetical protein
MFGAALTGSLTGTALGLSAKLGLAWVTKQVRSKAPPSDARPRIMAEMASDTNGRRRGWLKS